MLCPDCNQPIDITKSVLAQMGNVPEFIELARCHHCFSELLVNVKVTVTKR